MPKIFVKFIFVLTFLIFLISIGLRLPFIGKLGNAPHQELTANTINFENNWFNDGALGSHFTMTQEPSGPEFPNYKERSFSNTTPPFYLLPIHGLSLLFGGESGVSILMVHIWGILIHLLTALCIAAIVFLLIDTAATSYKNRIWAALSAGAVYLLHPTSLYFGSITYSAEQMLIPLLCGAILIEILLCNHHKNSNKLQTTQQVLFFAMALCDWYSIPVMIIWVVALFLYRQKQEKLLDKVFKIVFPFVFGWVLYLLQLRIENQVGSVLKELKYRIGIIGDSLSLPTLLQRIFVDHIGVFVVLTLLAFFAFYKKGKIEVSQNKRKIVFIILAAPLLQCFLMLPHSYLNSFSALKFIVPFAILVAGIGAHEVLKSRLPLKLRYFIAAIPFIFSLITAYFQTMEWKTYMNAPEIQLAEWIQNTAESEEVVLTKEFVIGTQPPKMLAITRKIVWQFQKAESLGLWSTIFSSVRKNSLIWISNSSAPSSVECYEYFIKNGAHKLSSFDKYVAFRFQTLEQFMKLPRIASNECMN